MSSPTVAPAQATKALALSTISFTICFAVWTVFSIIGIQIKQDLDLNEAQFGLLIGTPILTGTHEGSRLQLQTVAGELRNFRPAEGEYVPNSELASTGTVTMHFDGPQGSVVLPLVRWRKVVGDTFPTERHLKTRIALVDGAARVQGADEAP